MRLMYMFNKATYLLKHLKLAFWFKNMTCSTFSTYPH